MQHAVPRSFGQHRVERRRVGEVGDSTSRAPPAASRWPCRRLSSTTTSSPRSSKAATTWLPT